MKKYLLTLFSFLIFTTTYAQSDNSSIFEKNRRMKSFNVEVKDEGQSFQIDAKTIKEMPNAVELEIGSLSIIAPRGKIPGVLAFSLRPKGDIWIEMVGQQHGSFSFNKGSSDQGLPQFLPLGRYMLTIDGEVYGILVVKENKVFLIQGPKKPPVAPSNDNTSNSNANQNNSNNNK